MSFLHRNPPEEEGEDFPPGPCRHMRTLLSGMADGTLKGLLLRYARSHVAGCDHCRGALGGLYRLRERLQGLATRGGEQGGLALTGAQRRSVEAEWDRIDGVKARPPDAPAA